MPGNDEPFATDFGRAWWDKLDRSCSTCWRHRASCSVSHTEEDGEDVERRATLRLEDESRQRESKGFTFVRSARLAPDADLERLGRSCTLARYLLATSRSCPDR